MIKERKDFFTNNRLNKGYTKAKNYRSDDKNLIRGQFYSMLPNIDLVEQYEELSPGIFSKLASVVVAEQKHRHESEIRAQKEKSKKIKLYGIFFLIMFLIISVTIIALVAITKNLTLTICSIAGLFCISLLSFWRLSNLVKHNNSFYKRKKHENHHQKNSFSRQENR